MKRRTILVPFLLTTALAATAVRAQEPVVASDSPDALFTSADPRLHANKQVVYKIILDLLEAGHWDKASQYLADDYIQHNPNAKSGLKPVVQYFTEVLKIQPKPIQPKLTMKIAEVVAEGDLVVVTYVRTEKDPRDPSREYGTTWFDMWRIQNGKAVEHWDPALLNEAPDLQ